jgi:hypothetical protein
MKFSKMTTPKLFAAFLEKYKNDKFLSKNIAGSYTYTIEIDNELVYFDMLGEAEGELVFVKFPIDLVITAKDSAYCTIRPFDTNYTSVLIALLKSRKEKTEDVLERVQKE